MAKISVIIPVYNTECYLEKCLDSVINQSYKDIEIIVVDDCSSGNCSEIVEKYQARDSRILYERHQKNKGLFAARQTGVEKSSGQYILHLDSDDSAVQDIYEKLVQELSKNPQRDYIQFSAIFFHSTYQVKRKIIPQNLNNQDIFNAVLDLAIEPYFIWRYLLKRDLCLKVYEILKVRQRIVSNEDVLFLVVYSYYCRNFSSIKDFGCIYNCSNIQSVTRKPKENEEQFYQSLEQYEIVISYLEQFFQDHNLDIDRLFKIKQEFCRFFLETLKQQNDKTVMYNILKKTLDVFGGDVVGSFLYDVSFNLSMGWVQRKINKKIQNFCNQYFPTDSKQTLFIERVWRWFKQL